MEKRFGVFTIGLMLLAAGCLKDTKKAQAPVSMEDAVAVVNNEAISKRYFDKKFEAIKSLLKQTKVDEKEFNDVEIKKSLLDQLIRIELLAQEAQKRGLDKEDELRENLKATEREFLAQVMYTRLTKDINVGDDEIEKFYSENKASLRDPVVLKIREIATKSNAEAKEAMSKLMQGENMLSLIPQYSVAPTAKKDGLVELSEADKELTTKKFNKYLNLAFTLGKGELSPIFQGPDDLYYIIKVEAKEGGEVKSLDVLKDQIKAYLQTNKENKILQDIRNQSKVTKNEELLK